MTVELRPAELTAEPGELARSELRVRNTGDSADEFSLEVTGEPTTWAWIDPPALRLAPGEEGIARLRFRLPAAAATAAGRLLFAVRVAPTSRAGATTQVEGALEVRALRAVSVTLRPGRSRLRRTAEHTLTVENRGNVVVRAELRPAGERGVRVRVQPTEVEVEPGGTARARVEVRATRPLARGERRHAVTVEVVPDDAPAVTASATVVQEATLPGWPWYAAGSALLLAAGLTLRGTVLAPDSDGVAGVGARADDRGADADADAACPAEGHLGPSGNVEIAGEMRVVGRGRPFPRDHAFLMASADGCSPVRFDPCQPIPYVVNTASAPSTEALNDVHEAMARVAEASGLRIVFEGTTEETFPGPGRQFIRPPYQPDRYGERWAPVIVAWSSGAFAGRGGDERIVAGGGHPTLEGDVIVTAQVTLNADAVIDLVTGEPIPAGFGPGITWGRVLLHELGHAVGLGHVSDTTQLMHEPLTDHPPVPAEYAAGDRAGLRLVGRELGCLQTPPVPAG